MSNKAVEDNAYPPSRRVLGRFAPGTRRASGQACLTLDVRRLGVLVPENTREVGISRVSGGVLRLSGRSAG
jgi:hypothetical protein